MILPKPVLPLPRAVSTAAEQLNKTLHLDTSFTQFKQQSHQIDQARLVAIYSAHRVSFWSAIASEYGSHTLSPQQLEEAFLASVAGPTPAYRRAHSPPTPAQSPASKTSGEFNGPKLSALSGASSQGFNAINVPRAGSVEASPTDRCSVSSLLNDETSVKQ